MSWLSGFSNRLKLTVDNTNIDDTLTDFPVLIKISDTSGVGSTDVTSVFTELGSDVNRKKIAVTTDDETTQCYVEIERFDYANSLAWLWVKVPSVTSGAETILYLYYDVAQADNTSYVGDTTDVVTHNVWDSNFVGVWHMAQDPNGDAADAIKDSTSNALHGTPDGSMTTADLVDGKVGKAIEFDGTDDYVNCGADNILNITGDLTISMWVYLTRNTVREILASRVIYVNATNQGGYSLDYRGNDAGDKLKFVVRNNNSVSADFNAPTLDTWHHIVGVKSGTTIKLYSDSDLKDTTVSASIKDTPDKDFTITSLAAPANSSIDEVRVSNTARSASWIKATYYSNWDGLVSFGSEEEELIIAFTFTNPIPAHLSTTYGTTEQLQLTTTISGVEENYTYDTDFYDGFGVQVGTTVLGVSSGSPAASNAYLSTPSGVDYTWYVVATSSGSEETSSTYTFSNRFLYDGYITENDNPVNRTVRLYYRDTGELIDSTTSSGVSGYYNLSTTTNDEHFIVAFDDEAGEDYNALILDRLLPNGEE